MAVTYAVTIPQLESLRQAFSDAPDLVRPQMAEAINGSLVMLQAEIKQQTPVDTGHLRSSIQITPAVATANPLEGRVSTDVAYAMWVEQGTGIYGPYHTPIVPTTKKALAFDIGGTRLVRRSVRGMQGRFFFYSALERSQAAIEAIFQGALVSALQLMANNL